MPRRGQPPMASSWLGVLLLTASLTGLTGCGEENEAALSDDEQTAANNLAAQILSSGSIADNKGSVNAAQADCVAQSVILDVGLDRLQSYGIITDDLTVDRTIQGVRMNRADADAMAGVFVDCLDTEELFEKQFVQPARTPAQSACVRAEVDEASVREVLADSFTRAGTRAYDALQRRVKRCWAD